MIARRSYWQGVTKLLEVVFADELSGIQCLIQELTDHIACACSAIPYKSRIGRCPETSLEKDLATGNDKRLLHTGVPVLEFTRLVLESLK